ncbi:MAG: glycosyltransferase family 2 protein [Thiobacillaceae bacterium]
MMTGNNKTWNDQALVRPRVCVLILNWNGKQDTLECLASVSKMAYDKLDILVVDNGSADDSVQAVREGYPNAAVIETGANLGFAEGNNVGIRWALAHGADYVLLLNNDTTVDEDLINSLVAAAERYPAGGIFGPKIYYHADPARIWYAGGVWNEDKKYFEQKGDGEVDKGQYDAPGPTEFVIGCAMFIRSEVFKRIGLLEPKFFLNYEEIDFCTRARAAGFENIYAPTGKLWHKISVSFGGEESPLKIYFTFRNRLLWAERNLSIGRILGVHWSVYRSSVPKFLMPLLQKNSGDSSLKRRLWAFTSAIRSPANRAWLKGIRDYWFRRFGNCPEDVWELQRQWKVLRKRIP